MVTCNGVMLVFASSGVIRTDMDRAKKCVSNESECRLKSDFWVGTVVFSNAMNANI